MDMMAAAQRHTSLNTCSVQQPRATAQRIHIIFHLIPTFAILYYRFTNLIHGDVPTLPWALVTAAEVIFAFFWFLAQAFRWRPVARAVSLDNLPEDDNELPKVDVFICTADPSKEPTLEVMNTVLSAMGLDYPSDKLAVYLSDDGGAPSTLYAIKQAYSFAKSWLPFCRKYGIKSRCPDSFFSAYGHDELLSTSDEFQVDEENMKVQWLNPLPLETDVRSSNPIPCKGWRFFSNLIRTCKQSLYLGHLPIYRATRYWVLIVEYGWGCFTFTYQL